MADFDRTLELINISQESAGATNAQQVEFMQGLEAATIGLQTAYQQFIKTITDSDIIIGIIRIITVSIESLTGAMKLFGIEGSVAMLILGGFAVILKITSMMKGLTTATVGATKAQKIFNAVAAINPYVLIATAIAAVVVGIGYLATATERSAKALKKQNDEVAAASYEFNKLNKDIKSALETIEELNKLPFFSEEQQKELDDALEKIAELVGEKNVVRIDGIVDLELSKEGIDNFLKEQQKELEDSITKAYNNTVGKVVVRTTFINPMAVFATQSTTFEKTTDPETVKGISNYIIMLYKKSFDADTKLSGTVEKLYRNFIKETLATDPKSLFTDGALKNFVSSQMKESVKFLEESIKSIESNNKEFSKYYDSYLKNLAKGTALEKQLLNSQYKEFDILTTKYGSSATNLILQLEKIGVTDFTQIATAVKDFGEELPEVLEGLNNRIQEIMGSDKTITEQTATSMAFAELSRTIGNAELRL
jgi:predicted membrane protein